MKPLVILGHPLDRHAKYVAWALENTGRSVVFINSSHDNCPTNTTLYFDSVRRGAACAEWTDVEAAWYRRLSPQPGLEHSDAAEDEFARDEELRFTRWLIAMQESYSIRWINRPSTAQAAENKFLQLKFANVHGIEIPRTIVTAQPNRVRAFLRNEGSVVAKPLEAYSWKDKSGQTFSAFATVLDKERGSEISNADIARCVTIYQQCIEKACDVRVIIMGEDVFAFKVIQDGERYFDFRLGFYQKDHLTYEPISFPLALKLKTIKFMNSLKINFASADFALTADGRFIFLDLNPGGQWLFIEQRCPEAALGQKFCSFFVRGKVDSKAERKYSSFSEYLESIGAKSSSGLMNNTSPKAAAEL